MTSPCEQAAARQAKSRKARREAGLVRIEAWVPAVKADAARAAIQGAINEAGEQEGSKE